jgi:hypothetical protein
MADVRYRGSSAISSNQTATVQSSYSHNEFLQTIQMGKSLAQKKEIVGKVEKRISSAQLMFSLKLEKVTMPEINGLRNSLPAGTTAIVIKNRLLKRASSGTPWSATNSLGKGSNVWVIVDDDVKGSIKAFKDWQKANKKDDGIIGGVVEGQVLTRPHMWGRRMCACRRMFRNGGEGIGWWSGAVGYVQLLCESGRRAMM